jgi:DNA-binding transcriptional LysR family regulator
MAKRTADEALRVDVAAPAGPHLDDWNLLRSFIAVFDSGTLTEAARRLGTTQPSVGRHLRELEGLLGETLFTRTPGRLTPTERARALHAATAPMLGAVREAERLLVEGRERIVGAVRVAVSEVHAYYVVTQMLAQLLNDQPELEIELSVSNQADNLLRRDADIAVRFFRPEQDDVIARKVGDTELGLYAHESYLQRYGMPTAYGLPDGAFYTGFDRDPTPIAPLLHGPAPSTPLQFRFRSDAVLARHAAIECGAGIGIYFTDVAAERPGLKRVLAEQVHLRQEVWLCAHDELRRSARMRFVWEHLGDALERRYGGAAPPA